MVEKLNVTEPIETFAVVFVTTIIVVAICWNSNSDESHG